MRGFVQVSWQRHVPGILGGAIWCVGTTSNVLAAGVTGPAIAYAFGHRGKRGVRMPEVTFQGGTFYDL
jgi:hypothetical protein